MKEKLVLSPKREKIMTRGQFNRRKKSIWVYVIGVFLATVGLVLSIVAVDRSIQSTSANTQFTQEELNQVREIIRDNVAERKRVTDEIDARVNAQSRVLCITIATFIDSAKQILLTCLYFACARAAAPRGDSTWYRNLATKRRRRHAGGG